jgi:hypothetical protein
MQIFTVGTDWTCGFHYQMPGTGYPTSRCRWLSLFLATNASFCKLVIYLGRAIVQAVSRRLPTAAARIRSQVRSCGICGGRSGIGAGFLRVLRFPLPILIPPTTPHPSSIIRGWYNRPNSGRRTKWTQSQN